MVLQQFLLLSSLLLVGTCAFSAKSSQLVRRSSATCPKMSSSSALLAEALVMDAESDGVFLMSRATACANDETCSLDEAQSYLDDVLMIQKDCLDETLASGNAAICENVDAAVEVVATLRQKIAVERKKIVPTRATVDFVNVVLGLYVVSTIVHGFAAVPNVPVDAPIFTSFDTFAEGAINSRGVATVLPSEWFWSIRDGYFPMLFSEWIKNGGLVVDISAFDDKVVAFTPQEWVWSIQNGSLGDMMRENLRYGGYHVDSNFDTEGMSPMNAQDVIWSMQGGYFGDVVKHFFRNGGV